MEAVIVALAVFVIFIFIEKAIIKNASSNVSYNLSFSVEEAFEGDEVLLIENIHNKKILFVPWIKADIILSKYLLSMGYQTTLLQEDRNIKSYYYLKSFQKVTRQWKLKCTKRGIFDIQQIFLVSGGLFFKSKNSKIVEVNARLTVYPKKIHVTPGGMPGNLSTGNIPVKRWIMDDPFLVSGVREYMSGDSLDSIHWYATATERKIMVRKNDFTDRINYNILLNVQEFPNEYITSTVKKSVETGIRVIAGLVEYCRVHDLNMRFCSNGNLPGSPENPVYTLSKNGTGHLADIMEILVKIDLAMVREFSVFLNDIVRNIYGDHLIVVTSYINEDITERIRRILYKFDSVRIIVTGSCEGFDLPGDLDIFTVGDTEAV